MQLEYSIMLKWFYDNHRDKLDRYIESVSVNQFHCKKWLVKELRKLKFKDRPLKIEIIGSWFAWPLVQFLKESFNIERIRLYDIDPFACAVARKYVEIFNYDINIETFELSYWDHKQDQVGCDLLINTSSEHMKETIKDSKHNYYSPPFVAVQSNDKIDEPDHINNVSSVEELIDKQGLSKIFYKGTLELSSYNRFMIIGQL